MVSGLRSNQINVGYSVEAIESTGPVSTTPSPTTPSGVPPYAEWLSSNSATAFAVLGVLVGLSLIGNVFMIYKHKQIFDNARFSRANVAS
eukprot:JP446990.1.p1 GENE.JP446990.1~~JP446990.1.p1  ORF type:complete len:90 (+),score=12.90 JP446990.1:86-355(+)